MKIKRITITDLNGKRLYKGRLIGLDYNKSAINNKCIELFNDENPCIIHASYAVEALAEAVEKVLLESNNKNIVINSEMIEKLSDVDLSRYENMTIELEVKK